MYSGFVEVEKETDSNLFYWFFRDEQQAENAPLVFWINGGPGSSSMLGNLHENGPLRLIRDASNKIVVHSLNNQAWTAVANMVYVDQPIGVGYSYGHRKVTEGKQIGEYIIKFFKGFYEKHPEMKNRKLYISGESYGGKYLPGIAVSIIDYNANVGENERIPLKGVMIGNGFTDPLSHRLTIRQLALTIGHIQFDSIPELDMVEKRCLDANGLKEENTYHNCSAVASFISHMNGGMNSYDSRWPDTNSTQDKANLNEYLNDPEVLTQLHCESSHKKQIYNSNNSTVFDNFMSDGMVSYIDEHEKILDHNLTLLLFSGQFDSRDGPYGTQEWLKQLKWKGMKQFNASSRNLYFYISDDNKEIRIGGNFKKYKNLSLLVVYAAGHMVPSTQLALSRNMLSDIIYQDELQCHHAEGKCSLNVKTCNLMNNCTEHGSCLNGKCICKAGYYGADCSITTETLYTDSFTLNATSWRYFKLGSGVSKMKVSLNSTGGPITVYTRRGDLPSGSFYNSIYNGTEVNFYTTKETGGDFVAFFNPDLDNKIKVKLVTTDESNGFPFSFWVCIAFFAIFLITSFINVTYYCINKKSYRYTNMRALSIQENK